MLLEELNTMRQSSSLYLVSVGSCEQKKNMWPYLTSNNLEQRSLIRLAPMDTPIGLMYDAQSAFLDWIDRLLRIMTEKITGLLMTVREKILVCSWPDPWFHSTLLSMSVTRHCQHCHTIFREHILFRYPQRKHYDWLAYALSMTERQRRSISWLASFEMITSVAPEVGAEAGSSRLPCLL